MIRSLFVMAGLLAVGSLLAPTASAAVKVGDKAPGFEGINTDGKKVSLDDFKSAEAVVLVFTCNECPVAQAYEPRFVEFAKEYKDRGVAFVAINVNPESLEAMKQRVEEQGLAYPYVKDESGKSADEYGPRVTPHLYVLDRDRKIAYTGSFDDDIRRPEKHYLTDAVEAVLKGEKPATAETRAFGCTIKVKK